HTKCAIGAICACWRALLEGLPRHGGDVCGAVCLAWRQKWPTRLVRAALSTHEGITDAAARSRVACLLIGDTVHALCTGVILDITSRAFGQCASRNAGTKTVVKDQARFGATVGVA